jgi:hypothetical protein
VVLQDMVIDKVMVLVELEKFLVELQKQFQELLKE